jgi:hypothetical protein
MAHSEAYQYSSAGAHAEIPRTSSRAIQRKGLIIPIAAVVGLIALCLAPEFSINPCPADPNPGRYGSSVVLDGVYISGSPEFVGLTVQAIQRVWHTPSYRYIKRISSIEERDLPGRWAEISLADRRAKAGMASASRGCTAHGATLVHEGAHVVYGPAHKEVYAAHAQALREMGEPIAAMEADISSMMSSSNAYGDSRQAWRR